MRTVAASAPPEPPASPQTARCARRAAAWYGVFAVYAAGVALFSGPGLDRWWGIWAVGGYAAAAVLAWCWRSRRGRQAALAASLAGALAAPVVWLATRAPATPDVTVVTQSATLLLHHATPYLPPAQLARIGVLAYNPYLPVMTIFGMPRALGLPGLLGDPRPWLAAATLLLLAVAFRAAAQPAPMRRAAFATASPIMAFPIALGITDPPVLALTCLALALLIRPVRSARHLARPAWLAATTVGVACAMKYTAWPALVVLTAMIAARDGARACARFAAIAVATTLALAAALAPASLNSPAGLIQNTISFPLGLTHAQSPAQSPLPGHLLATIGSAGRLAAIILLITAGLAIAVSLLVRPPGDTTAAARRLALALTLMFALSPDTRFGYFAYPLGLLGWIALSRTPRNPDRSLSVRACGFSVTPVVLCGCAGLGRRAMKRFGVLCAVMAASLAVAGLVPAVAATAAVPGGGPVAVTPAPRIPAGARAVGPVPGAATVQGAVVLRPRNEAALKAFIAAVTTPRSAMFGHYLPGGAYARAFGPTGAATGAVRSQLAADGLRVTRVASDGLIVDFSGSASAVGRAFGTGLERYKLADGTVGTATTSAIRVPASIARVVSSVVGLDNLVHSEPVPVIRTPASARGKYRPANRRGVAQFPHPPGSPNACAKASGAASSMAGLTDDQIAHAYGAFGLYGTGDLGAGQHIAVYELEPFLPSDIHTFDTCYFGAVAAAKMATRLHQVQVDAGEPAGQGGGEAILDVEDVSAVAPGASIDVYEAPNSVIGALDEYTTIVNKDADKAVTSSWGNCEQAIQLASPGVQQAENFLFEQAAAQGQTVFAAAGDQGSDDCNAFRQDIPPPGQNVLSVDDPGSQPYVISVGGTTIDNAAIQPPSEHVWNDGAAFGSTGGGISMSWSMPAWQRDSRVPGIVLPGSGDYVQANKVEHEFGYPAGFCHASLTGATSATPCRTVPDVSAQADEFTGAITIFSTEFESPQTPSGWITIGGTSSSAPLWAAMLALTNASPTCKANPATADGVGFASPLLYAVASNPAAYKASFNDIKVGNNDIFGLDNGSVFPATAGYDMSTGLGSPQLTSGGGKAGLASYLCSLAGPAGRPAVTGLSPALLPAGGGTVTITGTGFEAGGSPAVAGIEVGSWRVPQGSFTVHSNTSITATFPAAKDTLPPGSPRPLDGAGRADVFVTLHSGLSSAPGAASTLEYVDETSSSPVPSITGISPYGGLETAPGPVTILGSGFTGVTKVRFGGVEAASFTVLSPFEIRATPAAYSGSVACAPSVAGQTPTTDICQAQVQVTSAKGTSGTGQILPPFEGALPPPTPMAVSGPPPGCGCEVEPAPTEFDYVPAPAVTSVSTSPANPSTLASEFGDSLITVTGRGFNLMTFDWTDFGDPRLAASQDFGIIFLTGSQMQIFAPPAALSTDMETVPFSVRTLAGQSPGSPVTYAGLPVVASVVNTATKRNGAADTGGTPITISGQGFGQAVGPLVFFDAVSGFSVGTQYTYAVHGDTRISARTVQQNPALVDVEVCTVTGCSFSPPADYLYLYPPGNPKVDSVSPDSGPAAGGTKVTISGQNLGCVTGVFFGKVAAKKFSNAKALLDCGSTTVVHATDPKGKAGTTVKVTITTVESDFTGTGPSKSAATFTYKP